jgi:hypothetical protein
MELADQPSPLTEYADDDLLVFMSMYKEDPETAEKAFNEFYKRYKGIVYPVVYKFCAECTKNVDELAKIIFNNAFFNAYQYAGSFSAKGETKQEVIKKRIIGWMVQIVRTEIKNQFSSQYDREKEQEAYAAMSKSAAAPSLRPSPKEIVVTRAFEQIPKDRDREIFYTYWFFYEETPGGNAKRLPDDVYENLARRYNTTRENIRQIISRCKKLVKDYIAQNTKI